MNVADSTLERFRERQIILPTFSQLENPDTIPAQYYRSIREHFSR